MVNHHSWLKAIILKASSQFQVLMLTALYLLGTGGGEEGISKKVLDPPVLSRGVSSQTPKRTEALRGTVLLWVPGKQGWVKQRKLRLCCHCSWGHPCPLQPTWL